MIKISELKLNAEDFRPYVPKFYSVGAMVTDGEFEFDNELGEGHYKVKPGDIILEGIKGEHWVVPREKFEKKYEGNYDKLPRGHSLNGNFALCPTKPSDSITWACHVSDSDVEIISPEGFKLMANNSKYEHGEGDFICCGDDNGKPNFKWGVWPVNGLVFPETYKKI